MSTISVGQDYTVASGQSLEFTDEYAFSIDGSINSHPTPSLTIAGSVSVLASAANKLQSIGVVHGTGGFYEESLFWVKPGGNFSVSSIGSSGDATGFYAGHTWAADFRNDGIFSVTSAATAIGVKVTEPGSFHFYNTGQLSATGALAGAVQMGGGGFFFNSATGVINATAAGSGASAYGVSLTGHTINFQNEGVIAVQDNNAQARSIGVYLEGGAIQFSVVNSGRIEADIAIQVYDQGTTARRTLTNSSTGVIVGDIVTGHSVHYTLNNSGSIVGNIYLSFGDDTYAGQSGSLVGDVHGGAGTNVLAAGAGIQTVSYSDATVGVNVNLSLTAAQATNFSTDTLTGFENLTGSAFGDILVGDGGNNVIIGLGGDDTLVGGPGDDLIEGGAGNDTLDGGDGVDTVSYASATAAVIVDLRAVSGRGTGAGGAGADTLSAFENVVGSAFGDLLTGDAGNNLLSGGTGDDTLAGGAGDDTLDGGSGAGDLATIRAPPAASP